MYSNVTTRQKMFKPYIILLYMSKYDMKNDK